MGYNIIEGIRELSIRDSRFSLISVIEIDMKFNLDYAGLYHITNGRNDFPKTKCDNFYNFLNRNDLGNYLDIVFFKFCYADFKKDSNIEEFFNYYSQTINKIKKDFPHLKIMHVTCPLYTHSYGLKSKIKNYILGDLTNVIRNKFNDMIKKEFNNNLIYDLAIVESTNLDKTNESFIYENNIYYALSTQYSDDDGHLNETGRIIVAKNLIKKLAEISLKMN